MQRRPRILHAIRALLLGSLLLAATGVARAEPEDRGPFTPTSWDVGTVRAADTDIPTKVYYATDTSTPGAIVAVMHGNLREGRYHTVLAETLASQGFVVVLPDMPCGTGGCDHDANARQLSALLTWAQDQAALQGTPIFGRAKNQRALVGHSFGALAAFLATARDPSVSASVLLDPRDDRQAAENQSPGVMVPSLHLVAEVLGVCNGGWDQAVFPRAAAPRLLLRVPGAAHCDVEDPSDGLCPILCGSGDPSKAAIFRRYTVAFLRCALDGAQDMAPYIGGAALARDEGNGIVDRAQGTGLDQLPCWAGAANPPDAGTPVPDSGVAPPGDASAMPQADGAVVGAPDAGGNIDLTPRRRDAGGGGEDTEGCKCRAAAAGTKDATAWPLLVLWLVLRGSRRGRRSPCAAGSTR